MNGPGGQASLPARDVLLAVVAALLVVVLGGAGVVRSRMVVEERRAASDAGLLAELVTGVASALEQELAAVAGAAQVASAGGATRPAGFVPATPGSASPDPALPRSVLDERELVALLARARDTGDALLSAPVDTPAGLRPFVVAPVYGPATSLVSTVQRRESLQGWILHPVDLAAVASDLLPPGTVASVTDGARVAATSAELPPDRLPEETLDVTGRQLTIRAGDPAGLGVEAITLALAAGTLLLAAAAAISVILGARALRERTRRAEDREAQVRLIGDVAPLVQQSLELSDVLPAVAVQLMDHFGLAGVALSSVTSGSAQVELFSYGQRPSVDSSPVLQPPARVAGGDTLSLALQRGGRSVAMLQLVAGRPLEEAELQSLRALTELVTAAVVNAALFASQQEALHRLRELDALKTVFLGTASHELRTPATAISGFASLLTSNWERFEDGQRRDFVQRIGANARSLSSVVQDLLDFSLLDKGTLTVVVEPVDLARLVGSVVERLAPMFTEHTIAFSAVDAPRVAGDVNGLERIVTNLLTNAVKFSPADTTVTVTVGPAGGGYGAQVVVADQGPGIPRSERAHVFTRFFRGAGEAVVQTRGVGIGLSVVAEFVARLRGDITIDDAPGGGARFTVRLPASAGQPAQEEDDRASTT